jgi:tetratricopeptide (TPR) repeat protein
MYREKEIMRSARLALFLMMMISTGYAVAQAGIGGPPSSVARDTTIMVRVSYDNVGGVPSNVRVSLVSWFGSTVDVRSTDGYGNAEFTHVLPGKYKLAISGLGIQTVETGEIDVDDGTPRLTQNVQVHKTDAVSTPGGITSVAAANIPEAAAKEYEKGMHKMERKDWEGAKKAFEQALAIYPKYALAQNGLATSYSNLGQGAKAVEMFKAALGNDERLQMANLYLGRFYYENKNFKEAEPYLLRAQAGDPQNAQILMVLANSQFRNGEYDQALATALKVRSLKDRNQYAMVHLIAADILTSRGQKDQAAAEYELFLKEDPKSTLAPKIREALASLRATK